MKGKVCMKPTCPIIASSGLLQRCVQISFQFMIVKEAEEMMQSVFANEILWGCVNTLLRVSALLFIRKIFGVTDSIRRFMTISIIISSAFGIALCISPLLVCRPISAAWDPSSSCDEIPSFVALEAIGLALDIAIAIVPVTLLWRINLPVLKKLSISLAFSVGAL